MNIPQYVENLEYILDHHFVDMILGDFSIDYLNDNEIKVLKELVDKFRYAPQIVQSPTFLSADSVLDHIFINPQMFTFRFS